LYACDPTIERLPPHVEGVIGACGPRVAAQEAVVRERYLPGHGDLVVAAADDPPGPTTVPVCDGWMSRRSDASSDPPVAHIHLPPWHQTCSNLPKLYTVVPWIGGHCCTRFQYAMADFQ
jgi:hypothetical protein